MDDGTRSADALAPAEGSAARRGIDLFRVAGVQIAIDWSWLVIFALLLWSLAAGYFPQAEPGHGWAAYLGVGLVGTLLFFASIVGHELAHAVVANRLGERVERITLFIFGGMAHLGREPRSPRVELAIAAVGPAVSVALGGVFWGVERALATAGAPGLWVALFAYLAFVNVALAVFNLLPGYPLDGGRLLRGVLWLRSGDLRAATARAANWGAGIAFGLMLLGVLQIFGGALTGGLWLVFIGMFLRGAAGASYQAVLLEQTLAGARVRDVMVPDPVVVPADATVGQAIDEGFLRYGFGGFPVDRDGTVAGIVSLRQVKACAPAERGRRTVADVMAPADARVRIDAAASVGEALRRMREAGSGRLLVTDADRVVGLVTQSGIARWVHLKTQLDDDGGNGAGRRDGAGDEVGYAAGPT